MQTPIKKILGTFVPNRYFLEKHTDWKSIKGETSNIRAHYEKHKLICDIIWCIFVLKDFFCKCWKIFQSNNHRAMTTPVATQT